MSRTYKIQCSRMDHGGCTLRVEVEDDRVVGIRPDPEGPLSLGHMCPKARAWPELLNHPQRLTRPLLRIGGRGSGQWREIPWSEALSLAAEGLGRVGDEFGAKAVAFCQGAPKGLEHFVLIRLANTFGSPNVVGPQNVCHMPREIAALLTCGFFPVPDYGHESQAVLVWGSNLTATNEEGVICSRLLKSLTSHRPPLIVVDPRRTELARRADYWLPLKPGTDLALALGFLNVIITENLFDRDFCRHYTHGFELLERHVADYPPNRVSELTGVAAPLLTAAARIFGRARPGLVQWGNGLEQNAYNFETARALLCLMALGGNLEAPGGNAAAGPPPVMRLGKFVRGDLQPERARKMLSAGRGLAPGMVIVPPEHFKEAVLTGRPYPVRAAYVQVSNPVLAWSDSHSTHEALKSLDYLVVTETFLSPTAPLADLVLPAATSGEFNDLGHFGLAHGYVLARPQVVSPPGQAWPNAKIINELGKVLGPADLWWEDYQDMLTDILAPSGWSYSDLARYGILRGQMNYHSYQERGFKTPTGRVELCLSQADKTGLNPLPSWKGPVEPPHPDFPLLLTGHKSRHFFCSDHRYLSGLRRREPAPLVEVHPDTAREWGLTDQDSAHVATAAGRIKVKVRMTENIRPGVLSVVHGWWLPELGPENTGCWDRTSLNVLTSSRPLNSVMGAPNLRGLPASIEPAGD